MPIRYAANMDHVASFEKLLDLYCRVMNARAGAPVPKGQKWLYHSESLAVKLAGHLASMRQLVRPVTISVDGVATSFIDHSSLKVVTRAAFETYLVFHYIYAGDDPERSEFRHRLWELGGLLDRQNYPARDPENREKLAGEARQAEDLRSAIRSSPLFETFTQKQQKRLLRGEWKGGKNWGDLGSEAGFHPVYFQTTYNYLCGYSHSSYLSVLQVDQARSTEDQEMLCMSMLGVGLMLMSHFVFTYSELFPDAAAPLTQDPATAQLAEIWRFGPDDMNSVYGPPESDEP